MEDSTIWWYLILGGIYMLSKFLKKKKPVPPPQQNREEGEIFQDEGQPRPSQNAPSSIEEILRELSEQSNKREEVVEEPEPPKPDPIPERKPQPIQTYSREPRPIPVREENIEEVKPEELIDIVPHKQLQREKPEYKRSEKFAIEDEEHELAEDLHDTFQDADGARKAFLFGEVFNRRY